MLDLDSMRYKWRHQSTSSKVGIVVAASVVILSSLAFNWNNLTQFWNDVAPLFLSGNEEGKNAVSPEIEPVIPKPVSRTRPFVPSLGASASRGQVALDTHAQSSAGQRHTAGQNSDGTASPERPIPVHAVPSPKLAFVRAIKLEHNETAFICDPPLQIRGKIEWDTVAQMKTGAMVEWKDPAHNGDWSVLSGTSAQLTNTCRIERFAQKETNPTKSVVEITYSNRSPD